MDASRRQVLLSRGAADLTRPAAHADHDGPAAAVEQAYWDWCSRRATSRSWRRRCRRRGRRSTSNERQVQSGTLAPIDVVEAQTQVANLRTGGGDRAAGADRVGEPAEAARSRRTAPPTLGPAARSDRGSGCAAAGDHAGRRGQLAMARRPELAAIDTSLGPRTRSIDQFYQDQARPQVDLVGSYTMSGVAGTAFDASTTPIGGTVSTAAAVPRRQLRHVARQPVR